MKKRSTLVRLYRLGSDALPLYFVALLGSSLVNGIMQVALAMLLKALFDAVAAQQLPDLLKATAYLGGGVLALLVVYTGLLYLFGLQSALITGKVRKKAFARVSRLPVGYFKDEHSGDLISRLTNDIAAAEPAYTDIPVNLVPTVFAGLMGLVYMYTLDPRLFIYAVVVGLLSVGVNYVFVKPLRVISRQVQKRLAVLTEELTDILAGMMIVKSFNLASVLTEKFLKRNRHAYQASMERVERQAWLNVVNDAFFFLTFIGMLIYASYLSMQGAITMGVAVGAIQILGNVGGMFRLLGVFVTDIQSALAAADRIFEVLDQEAEPEAYPVPSQDLQDDGDANPAHIGFQNVSFAYQGGSQVLKDLSFQVAKGERVALVGPSGGGKSTILKLILGFYQPDTGSIQVSGRPLAGQPLEELRDRMAFVPQESYLFAGTIAENLRYGRQGSQGHGRRQGQGAASKSEELATAAAAANALEFIEEQEDGFDTVVGERGAHLSGGQRQRIAIARAVLRDAPILLLDEATSALDSESEHLVQEALDRLMVDRTTLVIAHRLSTIHEADRILVIAGGRVVEEGRHEDLIQIEDGLYQQLHAEQFGSATAGDAQ